MDEEDIPTTKKKEKVLDWLWGLEEKRTVLGLLKGRQMKKELKDKECLNIS